MGVLTFTPSVPSGTKISAITPSSTASTSIVALSVSISAMTWPGSILSPALTCHLARLPSSMVGDSAGIVIVVMGRGVLIGFAQLHRRPARDAPCDALFRALAFKTGERDGKIAEGFNVHA